MFISKGEERRIEFHISNKWEEFNKLYPEKFMTLEEFKKKYYEGMQEQIEGRFNRETK